MPDAQLARRKMVVWVRKGMKRRKRKRPVRQRGRTGPCWQSETWPIGPVWRRTPSASESRAVVATRREKMVADAGGGDTGGVMWVGATFATAAAAAVVCGVVT